MWSRGLWRAGLILLTFILVGCGFQLRGTQYIKTDYRVALTDVGGATFYEQLERYFNERRMPIVSAAESDVVITVYEDSFRSNTVASSSFGREREYIYTYYAIVSVALPNGEVLMEPRRFEQNRNFSHGEEELLSKNTAETEVKQELYRSVIEHFIRALNSTLNHYEASKESVVAQENL